MCPDAILLPDAPVPAVPPREMSGLQLAFIGDCVYELMVRAYVLSVDPGGVQRLHRRAVDYANAAFQARAAETLQPLLTEAEQTVYRRGRNAHTTHTPKNKSEAQYHKATGFEALFGYLYLTGQADRLRTLFQAAVAQTPEENET